MPGMKGLKHQLCLRHIASFVRLELVPPMGSGSDSQSLRYPNSRAMKLRTKPRRRGLSKHQDVVVGPANALRGSVRNFVCEAGLTITP